MSECGHPVNTMNEHIRNLQERLQAKEEESTLLAASLRKAERERDEAADRWAETVLEFARYRAAHPATSSEPPPPEPESSGAAPHAT